MRRARPEPAEAKNHPVNGFSAPRAGGGTAPVAPGNPFLSAKEKRHSFECLFCFKHKRGRGEDCLILLLYAKYYMIYL